MSGQTQIDRLQVYGHAVDALNSEGYSAEVYEDYSGRGMFGDTVCAIVTDAPAVMLGWAITAVMHDLDEHDVAFLPRRVDSMGLGHVYY